MLHKATHVWDLDFWPCRDNPISLSSLSGVLAPAFSHSSYCSLDIVLRAEYHTAALILSVQSIVDTFRHEKQNSLFSRGEVLVVFLTAVSSTCIWPNRLAEARFSSHNCSGSYRTLLLSLLNEVSLALCPSFYLSECVRTFILTSIVWALSYLHFAFTLLTCRVHRPSFKELERLWRQKKSLGLQCRFPVLLFIGSILRITHNSNGCWYLVHAKLFPKRYGSMISLNIQEQPSWQLLSL